MVIDIAKWPRTCLQFLVPFGGGGQKGENLPSSSLLLHMHIICLSFFAFRAKVAILIYRQGIDYWSIFILLVIGLLANDVTQMEYYH